MPPTFKRITSFQNPKVKLVKKLRDKQAREDTGLFVIDAARDLERALACGYEVELALYCPALDHDEQRRIADKLCAHVAHVYEVSRELIEKVSYRENPSPVVAVMRQKAPRDYQQVDAPLILGLVNLQKPGNIGALLRSADATGFRAVFLIDTALDIYNPNVIRSSTGTCFLDNIYALHSADALAFLKSRRYTIIAATPAGETSLFDVDFSQKAAIILGAEDAGLSAMWASNCDRRVRIPMVGQMVDSLNVSVTGAVMMYEALRQRQKQTIHKN